MRCTCNVDAVELNIMCTCHGHPWYEAAVETSRDQFGGGLTPEEILGIWTRHPDWAPGGRWYRLPSSQGGGRVEGSEDAVRKLDPINLLIWSVASLIGAGTISMIVWLIITPLIPLPCKLFGAACFIATAVMAWLQ